jgi:hypothetical protein
MHRRSRPRWFVSGWCRHEVLGAQGNMLKLRTIGLSDYSVRRQAAHRPRLATERMPSVWLCSVTVHLPGRLPMLQPRISTRPSRSSKRPGKR